MKMAVSRCARDFETGDIGLNVTSRIPSLAFGKDKRPASEKHTTESRREHCMKTLIVCDKHCFLLFQRGHKGWWSVRYSHAPFKLETWKNPPRFQRRPPPHASASTLLLMG
jgi:hypothetical protein